MSVENHPKLTAAQIHALEALLEGDLVLANNGQYVLEMGGELYPDRSANKKALKVLRQNDLAEFVEKNATNFLWRITAKGREAMQPGSPWLESPEPKKRGQKPARKPMPLTDSGNKRQAGIIVTFVMNKMSKGLAYGTVAEATLVARRIQATYAIKGVTPPDIALEHRKYVGSNQTVFVKALNGDPSVIHETWSTVVRAHSLLSTYDKYEVIEE